MTTSRRDLLSAAAVTGAGALASAACRGAGAASGRGASSPDVDITNVAGPFDSLAGFCDGIAGPDEAERATHRERARQRASDAGYVALAMEAGVNLGYYTGGRWGLSERPLIYVLPVAGDPLFVGPAFEEGTLREAFVGTGELHLWHEHESPYAQLERALGARGIRGRIAVDPLCRHFVVEGMRTISGIEPVDGTALFSAVRMRKTEPELARLRRANEATKAALRLVAAQVEAGMSEAAIAELVRRAQETAGLGNVWALVLFGENAAYPHGTAKKRPLREGDMVLVDTGGSLHGYQSDITRTWPVGRPGDRARAAWSTVLRAQQAAMDLIRPGTRCADVDAAARAVVEASGFGVDYEQFTHRLGHGIGLQGHEEPYLVRGSSQVLEPGMTMSNEPGIYVPGSWGVRIEDIVAVTDTGVEVFGPRARSIDEPFGAAESGVYSDHTASSLPLGSVK